MPLHWPPSQAQGKYWEVAGTALGNVLGIKATDEESDGALSLLPARRDPPDVLVLTHGANRLTLFAPGVGPEAKAAAAAALTTPMVVTTSSKTIKEQVPSKRRPTTSFDRVGRALTECACVLARGGARCSASSFRCSPSATS